MVPPFVMGLFDKDVSEEVLLNNPKLYKQLHKQSVLNHWTFGLWILQSFYHAVAVFFFTWYVCYYNGLYDYKNDSLWITANMLASASFTVVNLKALMEYNSFTWIHIAGQLASYLSFYVFLFCYAGVPTLQGSSNMYWVMCKLLF
jgi:phospholipid-transporting ATPase